MRCIGVSQKCGQRFEICLLPVVDATPETMLMLASFPASQSQAANRSSVTIQNFEVSQNSESIQNSLEATQKTEQAEKTKQPFQKREQWFHEQKLYFIDLHIPGTEIVNHYMGK